MVKLEFIKEIRDIWIGLWSIKAYWDDPWPILSILIPNNRSGYQAYPGPEVINIKPWKKYNWPKTKVTTVSAYETLEIIGTTPVQIQVYWTKENKLLLKVHRSIEVRNLNPPDQTKIY